MQLGRGANWGACSFLRFGRIAKWNITFGSSGKRGWVRKKRKNTVEVAITVLFGTNEQPLGIAHSISYRTEKFTLHCINDTTCNR
uniref:Uncharacterized protein n=1 Tax=Leersia perrieri TaxID=77586 RepID=A0A0D9UYG6_9ORYZ